MTTLHDRLADLAGEAIVGGPGPGLWERGVRYRTRRRAGTAVVVAVAAGALAALGSVAWLRSPEAVELSPASAQPALPDRLYAPSPWLPGTEDAGPLGTVAAVIDATRGSWSGVAEQREPVGVSAVTGEYRFLDLPGLVPDTWMLAPDGHHVAYLYRVTDADLEDGLASGLAVYDTSSGEVVRHALPGELGITAEKPLWAGDDTVVLSYGTVTNIEGGGIGSVTERPLAWTAGEAEPRTLTDFPRNLSVVAAATSYVVGNNFGDRFKIADLATGAVQRQFVLKGNGWFPAVLDGAAVRVAVMPGDRTPNWFFVGSTTTSPVPLTQVLDERLVFKLVGWADDEHVAVIQRRTVDAPVGDLGLVDVSSGATDVVVHDVPIDAQVATDLLAQRPFDAVEPPHPMDPRQLTGVGVGIVLAAGLVLVTWRRRVRP